jgi:hypothetical protein
MSLIMFTNIVWFKKKRTFGFNYDTKNYFEVLTRLSGGLNLIFPIFKPFGFDFNTFCQIKTFGLG